MQRENSTRVIINEDTLDGCRFKNMPRPKKWRCVNCHPCAPYFKPIGGGATKAREVFLSLDEVEALRLADLEGKYHTEAASEMKISRGTFGRIVNEARRKVAEAIIGGRALRIETEKREK